MTSKPVIGPLPGVPRGGPSVSAYLKRTVALPKTPLLIEAVLVTNYATNEPQMRLHLDSILAWAVLQTFPVPLIFPQPACVVPLPLEILSIQPGPAGERLPVWAASDLIAVGETLRDQAYWHKRYPTDRADLSSKKNADKGTGRWKEYRVPQSTVNAPALRATCIGHPASVRELLSHVSHVGKKGSQGYGRVVRWDVIPLPDPVEAIRDALQQERPMPGQGGGMGGFTPPYWYRPWHVNLAGAV